MGCNPSVGKNVGAQATQPLIRSLTTLNESKDEQQNWGEWVRKARMDRRVELLKDQKVPTLQLTKNALYQARMMA